MSSYQKRREKIYDWMAQEGIALVMVEDFEERRNPALRWLSGQPGDALLFLSVDRRSILVPWDKNLARLHAEADALIPYDEFDRRPIKALRGTAERLKIPKGSRIEISGVTPYPRFLKYVEEISDFDVICRENGVWAELEKNRAVKDEAEINIYRKVTSITNDIIALIEKQLKAGKIKTEYDAAMIVEGECRKRGCEGTGFETLAAGPERSMAIHSFPAFTISPFGTPGLSISTGFGAEKRHGLLRLQEYRRTKAIPQIRQNHLCRPQRKPPP